MRVDVFYTLAQRVALLAEGVDRNFCASTRLVILIGSPSSRRAWIEILRTCFFFAVDEVALLAEGVDRNFSW